MQRRSYAALGLLVIAWIVAFALPFASESATTTDGQARALEYSIGEIIYGGALEATDGISSLWRYLPVFFSLILAFVLYRLTKTGKDEDVYETQIIRALLLSGILVAGMAALLVFGQDLRAEPGFYLFVALIIVATAIPVPLSTGQLLLYPAMTYVIIVTQIPFILTIYYSFRNYRLLRPDQNGWAGLENYRRLWDQVRDTDSAFFAAIFNTVVLTAGSVIFAVIVGLIFAELVNHRFFGRAVVRTLLITPFLIMPAAAALSWKNLLYNPNFGFLDWFTSSVLPGSPSPNWLGDYPVASIMTYLVWRWAPFMMLIFLAGMGSISEEVREAARMDGATAWEEFRSITLPHLRRFFMLGSLLGTVYIFQDFDPIYLMTQGGPGNESTNLSYLVYSTALRGSNYGQASAIGVVTVILSIIAVTYLVRLLSKVFEGELSDGR